VGAAAGERNISARRADGRAKETMKAKEHFLKELLEKEETRNV